MSDGDPVRDPHASPEAYNDAYPPRADEPDLVPPGYWSRLLELLSKLPPAPEPDGTDPAPFL